MIAVSDRPTTAADTKATLKDGSQVHIRPIRPEDDNRLVETFRHLSPETVYQRFFTSMRELTPVMARYLASAHYVNRMALIAESEPGSHLIGIARYERTDDPKVVELGLVVIDEWQNRGLGRILLREILRTAERNGIHRFRAEVLAENRRMLRLLTTECEIQERKIEAGVTTLFFTPRQS